MKPYKVYLSPTAQEQYLDILDYLYDEWSEQVKQTFQKKFDQKIDQIAYHPKSCPASVVFTSIYKAVVEKHTSFYYRIKREEVEILTIVDNRQDPEVTRDQLTP